MTRNIADAVELLPRLTSGIDVNIMFNDVRGFEVLPIPLFILNDFLMSAHRWKWLGSLICTAIPDSELLPLCFAVHRCYCYL